VENASSNQTHTDIIIPLTTTDLRDTDKPLHDTFATLYLLDPSVAKVVLTFLMHISETHKKELFHLVKLLFDLNDSNKKMACKAGGLNYLLKYMREENEEEWKELEEFSPLIVILGSYSITPREVELLFYDAQNSNSSASEYSKHSETTSAEESTFTENTALLINTNNSLMDIGDALISTGSSQGRFREEEIQMQLLYVIGRISERKSPPSFFSFNGVESGIFVSETVDSFPKNGYTISFWIQFYRFLCEEATILALLDAKYNILLRISIQSWVNEIG